MSHRKPFLRIFGATMLILAAGAASAAQPGAPAATSLGAGVLTPGPLPLERFVKPLGLTPAQQAKLKPLFAAAQAQAVADVKEASAEGKKPDPAEMARTVSMRQADFRLQLATILTPEQLVGYERLTAERTPREQAVEMHSAHGHREVDTPATAADR